MDADIDSAMKRLQAQLAGWARQSLKDGKITQEQYRQVLEILTLPLEDAEELMDLVLGGVRNEATNIRDA